jgi:hypothetical protein
MSSVTQEARARWLDFTVERLDAENKALRRKLRLSSRHARRVRLAFEDAQFLTTAHIGYLDTGRAAMERRGITKRRWECAVALLKMARVLDGSRWRLHDAERIGGKLERAVERAIDEPGLYRVYLPPYIR